MSDKGKNKYPSGAGMGWMMSCELVSTRMNKREVLNVPTPERENLEGEP